MSTVEDGGSRKGLEFKDPSLTKQNFKDEVDINLIIKRFYATGQLPPSFNFQEKGRGADLSDAVDFHQAMNLVKRTERTFSLLTAEQRKRFDNDPEKFLEFFQDPENYDEALELGLVQKPVPESQPMKVQVVNPPAPAVEDGKAKPA